MQIAIVSIILLACTLYAGYRIRESIRHANDKCYGCSGCALKDLKNCKKK